MEWSGLPVWAFGIAFTIFNLFAALASHLAHRVDRRCGRTGTLVLLVVLQIAPLLVMPAVVGPLSFLFILGHQAVRGLATPIISARILRYTFADKRATVLSIAALAGRLLFAATAPIVGLIAKHGSMSTSLLSQAAVLILLLGTLLVAYVRIPAKYFQVKSTVTDRQ
jgi:MFS family permease